uniref:Uncharacterized protein n=1 Tax=Setaria italica TaxID=4555 RepID=K3Y458_SETIT
MIRLVHRVFNILAMSQQSAIIHSHDIFCVSALLLSRKRRAT